MDYPITTRENRIEIDGEHYIVKDVCAGGYLPLVTTEGGKEFYVARDAEHAGEKAREYWEDMANDDPAEFRCIIGDERLIAWALGRSDGFGFTCAEDFFGAVGDAPQEEWASYDGHEREVGRVGRAIDEIGFCPTVAYRHN